MTKKFSKHRSIEDLIEIINSEELSSYYMHHTRAQTEDYFNLSTMEFKKLADHLKLFNIKRENKHLSNNEELSKLSEHDILNLFLKNSNKEIIEKYNLSISAFIELQDKYNLKNVDKATLISRLYSREEICNFYKNNSFTDVQYRYGLTHFETHQLLNMLNIKKRSKEEDYRIRKASY